jgi:hypothetical protein
VKGVHGVFEWGLGCVCWWSGVGFQENLAKVL